jgi:AcrR family transcriptional regulator
VAEETLKKRSRRGRLNAATIVAAAVAIADSDGLQALTMRRLARALGVEAMSLYNHVEGKRALIDAMIARVLEESPPRPYDESGSWQELLTASARHVRSLGHAHPWLFPLLFISGFDEPESLRLVENTLRALRRGGFAPEETVFAYRHFMHWVYNFMFVELTWSTSAPAASFPVADLPFTREYLALADSWSHDQRFEFGLEANLAGLEVVLARRSSEQPGPS